MKPTVLDLSTLNPAAAARIQAIAADQLGTKAQYQPGFEQLRQAYSDASCPVVVGCALNKWMGVTASYRGADTADWSSSGQRLYRVFSSAPDRENKQALKTSLQGVMALTHDKRLEELFESRLANRSMEKGDVHLAFKTLWQELVRKLPKSLEQADVFALQLGNQWSSFSKREQQEYVNLFTDLDQIKQKRQSAGSSAFFAVGIASAVFFLPTMMTSVYAFASSSATPSAQIAAAVLLSVFALTVIIGCTVGARQRATAAQRFPFPDSVHVWCNNQYDVEAEPVVKAP